MERESVVVTPSALELGRRKALVARILSKREERVIAPLTTAELVHQAREQEATAYDPGS